VDGREDELDGEEMTDDYLNRDFEYMLDGWRAMQQEVIRLREENKKLREALNPFADAWEDREIWQSIIDIDDLRAAAAAIRESVDE
jgi:hypothetical protein